MGLIQTKPRTTRVTRTGLFEMIERGGPLLNGRNLKCPGCEDEADILDYIPLEHSEKYAEEVIVPLKCRRCRHVFALKP